MAEKKMIVLGMDGLDPKLLKLYMSGGKLPHFSALAKAGSFSDLQTSNPPQSPVAWSCFISGHNPGHHDVFDFVIRNPSTYMPDIGMTETKKTLMAGLTGDSLQTRRKGKAFWDYLSEKKIPSVILRCPVTFPAEPLEGRLLSGMGTPDIRGTQGTSTFFSTKQNENKDDHGFWDQVTWNQNKISAKLNGPKVRGLKETTDISVPILIEKLNSTTIRLTLDGTVQELSVGQWSQWFRVKFKAGFMKDIYGIVRFHFNAIDPAFEIYATPVNIDPQSPALVISYPSNYAKELFQQFGNYYTQGMPYDTWALNEGRLSEEQFLEQAYGILDENLKTLDFELGRFKSGFLFSYFGITDLVQHMFWRYIDPKHPNKGTSKSTQVTQAILNVYEKMDAVLGDVQKKMPADTFLVVMSDHGFGSFRRAVHINSWLHEKGYLVFIDGESEGQEFFSNVDWSQTRAYSVGFGGIYINQFGREKNGVVYKGAEKEALKKEITSELKKWTEKDGTSIVKDVYPSELLYSGPYSSEGPDLYIGFSPNYRASWQTGLGAAPVGLVEDNLKHWSGDHLCDPSLVPGILLSNKKLTNINPTLLDVGPTILKYFDLVDPNNTEGKTLN